MSSGSKKSSPTSGGSSTQTSLTVSSTVRVTSSSSNAGRTTVVYSPVVSANNYTTRSVPKSAPRAADPVSRASVSVGAPMRRVDTSRYIGPAESLIEQSPSYYYGDEASYAAEEGFLGNAQEPVTRVSASNSALRIKAPKLAMPAKAAPKKAAPSAKVQPQKSTKPPASSAPPRDTKKEALTCKARPSDNKPKAGRGSGKRFVPWC